MEPAAEAAPMPGLSPRRLAAFAVTLGLLAGWLALGAHGGLYLLQTRLPVVGQFRAPARYFNLVAFAAAALAALAFRQLAAAVKDRRPSPWAALLLPWLAVAGAVAAALALSTLLAPAGRWSVDRRLVAGPATAILSALALTLAARGRALGLYGLLLLAGWDLWHFSLNNPVWGEQLWRQTVPLATWREETPRPPGPDAGRILYLEWEANRQLLRGGSLVNGYRGGIEPRKRLDYTDVRALRLAAAGWYRQASFGEVVQIGGLTARGDGWYQVPAPLPRVRLVSQAVPSDDPHHDVEGINIDHVALTEATALAEDGDAGTATLLDDQPGHRRVLTKAPGPRLLVVAESHDPGWKATIDGRPCPVERVNGDFLGCVVGPGRHAVELTFAPAWLPWARVLSAAALAACLVLAGVGAWRGRARVV
jgi:hypothetical protein